MWLKWVSSGGWLASYLSWEYIYICNLNLFLTLYWAAPLIFRVGPNFSFVGCCLPCSVQGGASADLPLPNGCQTVGRPRLLLSADSGSRTVEAEPWVPNISAFFSVTEHLNAMAAHTQEEKKWKKKAAQSSELANVSYYIKNCKVANLPPILSAKWTSHNVTVHVFRAICESISLFLEVSAQWIAQNYQGSTITLLMLLLVTKFA